MSRLPSYLQKADAQSLRERGQALLIVLLSMTVILTVVLSVVSRSVTEITTTTYEENALRAFSAAEAGVEDVLFNPASFVGQPPISAAPEPNVFYTTTVTEQEVVNRKFRYPKDLVSGETATFWLVSHTPDNKLTCLGKPCFAGGTVDICWGDQGSENTPAVEILYFYDTEGDAVYSINNYDINYASVKVKKFAFDPVHGLHGNNFSDPNLSGGCDFDEDGVEEFEFRSRIDVSRDIDSGCAVPGCSLMIKVRMYYADDPEKVGIWASTPLPSQGYLITSIGGAGESTRRIGVFQGYPEPPTVFDAAVFSFGNLRK